MTRKKMTIVCALSGAIATITGAVTGVTLIEQGKAHTRIYDDDDDKSTNFEK
jgi:hypothetical protein